MDSGTPTKGSGPKAPRVLWRLDHAFDPRTRYFPPGTVLRCPGCGRSPLHERISTCCYRETVPVDSDAGGGTCHAA